MTYRNPSLIRRPSRLSRLDTLLLVLCLAIVLVIVGAIYLRQAGYIGRYVAPLRVGDITTRPVNESFLTAIRYGYEPTVKRLLDSGVSPDSVGQLGSGRRSRIPAIQSAAAMGNVRMVRLLLDYGADINAPGIYGTTAISSAAWAGHVDVVRLLIERGADVNAATESGIVPLRKAKDGLDHCLSGNSQSCRGGSDSWRYRESIEALEQAGARGGLWWPPQKPSWWTLSWWPF